VEAYTGIYKISKQRGEFGGAIRYQIRGASKLECIFNIKIRSASIEHQNKGPQKIGSTFNIKMRRLKNWRRIY
jgi:hypothetical protein